MPPGGDGFYYVFVYLHVRGNELVTFDVEINGEFICTALSDLEDSSASDSETTSCGAVIYAVAGICHYHVLLTGDQEQFNIIT